MALLAIFIYILLRFSKWQYSLGGVVSLFHDAFITLGMFSLLRGVLPFLWRSIRQSLLLFLP
ncbi:MAG: hypothetical protein IPH57_03480 [Saprospiraceae bacterium]|nr:hypothetical protein [Saprospiraceae bacterium]